MEVHHHAHTARKKWTHYFWEFLMLFLAVFCGFLAENKREHIVENHRAKEYAQSLIADLSSDITTVQRYSGYTEKIMSYLDSLANIIGENRIKQVKGSQLYYYGRFCNGGLQILWHNATFEQIKNSGGLRYFKDISLVKKISGYYSKTQEIDSKYETDLTRIVMATDLRNKIFRSNFLAPFTKLFFTLPVNPADSIRIDNLKNAYMPLQSYDNDLLNQLANICLTRKLNYVIALSDYETITTMSIDLIAILRKEYHLQ